MSLPPRPPDADPGLPEDDAARVAEYALGLLPEDERLAFAARLAREAPLRAELALWEEALAALADGVSPVAPPPGAKRRVEAALFGDARRRRASGLLPWSVAALASAVAAVILVLAWPLDLGAPPGTEPVLVSEIAGEAGAPRVLAAYDRDLGAFRLARTDGDPPPGRAFELWAIASDGVPVSLGLLPEDGIAPLPEALRDQVAALTLAISDEPAGGSPTGAPTGAILAAGSVLAL